MFWLSGCAPKSQFYEKIPKEHLTGKIVAIQAVNPNDISIHNVDDLNDDWSELNGIGAAEIHFSKYINSNLIAEAEKKGNIDLKFLTDCDFIDYADEVEYINEVGEIKLKLPSSVNCRNKFEADFVIVMGNFNYSRNGSTHYNAPMQIGTAPGGGAIMGGGGSSSSKSLTLSFDYFIKDLKNNKLIGYGKTFSSSQFQFAMTKFNWEVVSLGVMNEILGKSPFKKIYWR
jgi:hypothetical protein